MEMEAGPGGGFVVYINGVWAGEGAGWKLRRDVSFG